MDKKGTHLSFLVGSTRKQIVVNSKQLKGVEDSNALVGG